jgi:hypothetical protein
MNVCVEMGLLTPPNWFFSPGLKLARNDVSSSVLISKLLSDKSVAGRRTSHEATSTFLSVDDVDQPFILMVFVRNMFAL